MANGEFNYPCAVFVDRNKEHVYVADGHNFRIQVFDLDGNYLRQWGTLGYKCGQFNSAYSLAFDTHKERLTQVFDNILSNAIKFTKQGRITVSIERTKENDKEFAVVSVKDTGSGIDSEILPRLFTKFATKSETGTGLGLYICKRIIETHGGKIWAENNLQETGATFSFSIALD